MKPTLSSQDEEIIELLKRLGTLKAEYPAELFAARRVVFAAQVEERKLKRVNQEEYFSEERVIQLLESLKPIVAEYPPELLSARRTAFLAQVEQYNNEYVREESPDPVTELLENLKSAPVEYPSELLSARREAFLAQIRQHNTAQAPEEVSPEEDVIDLLGSLKSAHVEYPPEMLSARRAAFLEQVRQHNNSHVNEDAPTEDRMIELLGSLRAAHAEYPPELLSARRAAFIAQIERHNHVAVQKEPLPSHNGSLLSILGRLKSLEIEYPLKLWSSRRSAFVTQIREGKMSVLDAVRSAIQHLFNRKVENTLAPPFSFRRTSMILATLLVAAFIGSLAYGRRQSLTGIFGSPLSQQEGSQASPVAVVTNTGSVAQIICKPGFAPPLCLAQESDQSQNLSFPGNGSARPAVAKDTLPGYSRIHKAAFVNDGLYGPGASWISNSAYSWIKIDLGDVRTINTITFGRDRLGNLNDGDPGQFIIAVALFDDIYADGNSHNDSMEYTEVYNSDKAGFDGIITGPETIEAKFDSVEARFVKITFENAGTAVDEIEAFMLQPTGFASNPTQRPRDTLIPPSFTPIPTNTLIPTWTPTLIPTNTLVPTWTPTLIPTNTLVPTYTPFPTDTATPRPTHTPRPTSTDVPTDTSVPPTDTSIPPTDTPEPPPTNTPEPPPTDTSEPPSATSMPLLIFSPTPETVVP